MDSDGEARNERERELHARLLDGDPLATFDAFAYASPLLLGWIRAKYQTTDDVLIEQAISETLLDYFDRPGRFDPGKRSLRGYLFMAAERDLLNLREREERHATRTRPAEGVEFDSLSRKAWSEGADFTLDIEDEESLAEVRRRAMSAARTEEERVVQGLRLQGETATAVYAAALGWQDLPAADQRARLYKIKDRLDHRLRRERRHE